MHRPTSSLWPSLSLALVGAAWGLFWLPTRQASASGLGPAWFSLALATIALLAFVPLAIYSPSRLRELSVRELVAGFLVAGPFAMYAVALVLTTVLNAVLLFYLNPIWGTLVGRVLYKEPLRAPRIVALLLGLIGLCTILGLENGIPFPRNLGDWLALGAGVVFAIGSGVSHKFDQPDVFRGAFALTIGSVIGSGLLIAILPAYAAGPMSLSGLTWSTMTIVLLMGLGFVLPSNFLITWGVQQLPAARVGILLMTEVVAGAVSAAFLSGEAFGWRQELGSALIIAAGATEVLSRDTARAAIAIGSPEGGSGISAT
jgi:drug/metabolite transporter (DMT)-like permease